MSLPSDNRVQMTAIEANGVQFAALHCGSGPLALCLHGFPDSAHTWRHLLPALADAGFHAVAPFQRGYAPTQVPPDGRYQTGVLAADAIALHEALGGDSNAVVIGHDWGASSAYGAAAGAPERWRKVVTLAVAPAGSTSKALRTNIAQVKRSWYMFFFQNDMADVVVGADDLAFIDMLWADWSPGFDASAELPAVKASLGTAANVHAALGYYRASMGGSPRDPALAELQQAIRAYPSQPTLYLHGRNDGCIGIEVAIDAAASLPANITMEIVEGAGHFLQLERPDVVNERIIGFVS